MTQEIKALLVREFFRNGQLVQEDTTVVVYLIDPGAELSLGFARLSNMGGHAFFRVVSEFHGNVDVTPDLSVPCTKLNGQIFENVGTAPFNYGDVVHVYGTYPEDLLVSQDTVVLVPPQTPAQFKV